MICRNAVSIISVIGQKVKVCKKRRESVGGYGAANSWGSSRSKPGAMVVSGYSVGALPLLGSSYAILHEESCRADFTISSNSEIAIMSRLVR